MVWLMVCVCAVVNADREDGKVTLITRYGAGKVSAIHTQLGWYSYGIRRSSNSSATISMP